MHKSWYDIKYQPTNQLYSALYLRVETKNLASRSRPPV